MAKKQTLLSIPAIRALLVLAGIALIVAGVWFFRSIVAYVLISGVLSLVGRPLVDRFNRIHFKKIQFPKALSALFTLIILWGLIGFFFYIFIPLVTVQINELSRVDSQMVVDAMQAPLQKAEEIFQAINSGEEESLSLQEYFTNKVSDILNISFIQNLFGTIMGTLGNFILALFSITFITFFFLKDERLFYDSIMMWIPEKYEQGVRNALSSTKRLLMRYFIGIIFQSTIIMILITLGMTLIAGLPLSQALVIGLIVGILNVIPYVGPWIAAIIAVILGVATNLHLDFAGEIVPMVGYMLLVVALVQVTDNLLLQPVIFSNSVNAHPLEIFIVILAAGSFAGVAGMILAIPGYTVLRVFAKEFFNKIKAVQKITSSLDRK